MAMTLGAPDALAEEQAAKILYQLFAITKLSTPFLKTAQKKKVQPE